MTNQGWELRDFELRLREWIAQESPAEFQWKTAARWVLELGEDPYRDMRSEGIRLASGEDLYFGAVPNTIDVRSRVVVCSCWINPIARTVRCDRFATLSWPA